MTTFEAAHLPEEQREQLCRDLLAEFGVTRVKPTTKGELIHSCPLPFGQHRNGDRNPSASLNWKKLTFNCLGCGASGGLLWFISACRGEESAQSRAWLEKQTGLGGTVMELPVLLKMLDDMAKPSALERTPLPRYDVSMLKPWLWNEFHPYLTTGMPEFDLPGRGIPEETLRHFQVGYAPEYFMGRHEPTQERLIFPQFWRGELVGWQARRIDPQDEPKYKNSPDFPRDRTIYNYDNGNIGAAVVVESPASVLRHFHHVPEIQATFGAKVTDEQVRFLHRYENVVLWFDNDNAGWKATQDVGNQLARYNTVWVVDSPYAADPADMPDELVNELLERQVVPHSLWKPPSELIPWRS
jgi:hypothetical protein